MYVLAFETSCDDTSVAIFEDRELKAMKTASQVKTHNQTGGVVPEVAAREHANAIFGVLENTLQVADITLEDIDHIAVTVTPGLIPSLLTGLTVARTLANIYRIPLHEINHIHAHIFANFLERKQSDIEFPLVCLTVSGGHNEIYHMQDMWDFHKIGGTTDDAAGEAYDKVAKMMGLGYPGGPIISKMADEYTTKEPGIPGGLFPRVWLDKDGFDFSFSGLKSAVKREVDRREELSEKDQQEISYEFQNAVNEVLAYKLIHAAKKLGVQTCLLAGGVSANDDLRDKIATHVADTNLSFLSPTKKIFCMDNAAMVGITAYYTIISKSE